MMIKEMFQKDIRRPIQGVVKIGQDSEKMVVEELSEYVVTKELNRHFDIFFDRYRKGTQQRTDKIGVWISGFFGSGKSHFLKILSYLLSDKTYGGKKAIGYFEDKIKDSRILADMQVAAATNADTILFNIDAEADSDSKTNKDPIVKVFMKVFNKMRGFCASMPWIADLERQMVNDGSYQAFRDCFREISGTSWEDAREDFYFEQDNIVNALSQSTKMSREAAQNWYNRAEDNYALDINTFARRVREYIEATEKETGKRHFVIFLCDEVGQYIGSSGALMLGLQNIVEGLGNECGGQAWVIATGQEDIDSIAKVNRDAFSKIIGRFDTRLTLSSANVDEVIKERLLAKTDTANDSLRLQYNDKAAVIKNLITFSHDTPQKWLYDSADDFAAVYPFIPYQFNLLQAVFNGIRTHGASGKHLSEGERSLLNAFQEAAMQFASFDEGILIPFDAFYRTVESFLDHNIHKVILDAEQSVTRDGSVLQPDDVQVLKVLFMLKYIPNVMPANLENIATVMLQNIDQDKIEAKKIVDASLRRLEAQKLIIKNGDMFIFLTNEEQDINREIREIRIDRSEIIEMVGGDIFSTLFGLNKKYRYSERYDFSFNTLIDDRPLGAQKEEIGLRVLTPMFSGGTTDMELKSMSIRERNVIVALPANDMSYTDEMEQSLQIETYLRRNAGKTSTNEVENIKIAKLQEGKQRTERCHDLVMDALKKADIYVNGMRLDIKEKQPDQRINDAFKTLVESIYTKQSYITDPYYSTESLREILLNNHVQKSLEGVEPKVPNNLALTEMLDVIDRSSYKNLTTTMRNLVDLFGKIPYGWKETDIAGVALTLFKKQEIKLELSGENILTSDLNVINYVTKRDFLDRVAVKARVKISPALISLAKNIAKDVFSRSDVPGDEDGLMARIKEFAAAELSGKDDSIRDLLHEYDKVPAYPGKQVLEIGRKLLEQLDRIRDIKAFYDTLQMEKGALQDYANDVLDVKMFFKNQRPMFDKALQMLKVYEGNRSYVLDPEMIRLAGEIEHITRLNDPYPEIHKLPELIDQFRNRFVNLLEEECKPVRASIEADRDATLTDLNRRAFKDRYGEKVRADFNALMDRLSHANNVYEAIAMQTESDRMKLRFMQSFADEEARLAIQSADHTDNTPPKPLIKTKTVSVKTLFSGTAQISSRQDIDRLLNDLRLKLEAQLEEGTTIRII